MEIRRVAPPSWWRGDQVTGMPRVAATAVVDGLDEFAGVADSGRGGVTAGYDGVRGQVRQVSRSGRIVRIRRRLESIDVVYGVEVVVERVQVAEPLSLHVGDKTGVDERERFVSAEQ